MNDANQVIDEETFQCIVKQFELSDDPIAIELKAGIMKSAAECPHTAETCPHIN